MSEPMLMKRLHVSGLTPSITPADLERRLSSFGKVKAMDGFGARDALGDPRKFGFVTMEIGPKELAKCLNVLSGSTWKGAKLRIGEAKPDYRERLAQINSQSPRPVRRKRTHYRNHGYPSSTLPLTPFSAATAASTPGWVVTPSGRVVRPMRMRPERPLEPMHNELGTLKVKGITKGKKRIKPPPVRARRRLIDPTKWDSVYLKGVFLDAVDVPLPTLNHTHNAMDKEDGEETDEDSDACSTPPRPIPQLVQDHAHIISSAQRSPEAATTPSRILVSLDVREEANAALAMLGKMFGDKEDWDGRESIDETENLQHDEARDGKMQADAADDIEIVPRDFGENEVDIKKDRGKDREWSAEDVPADEEGVEVSLDPDAETADIELPASVGVSAQATGPAPRTDLKALFAPKEDASFSLVNHLNLDLDLDLELDADVFGIGAPSGTLPENGHPPQLTSSTPHVVQIPATKSTMKVRSRVALDPTLPLLFPVPDSLPHPCASSTDPTAGSQQHGTPSCFLFPLATRVRGLRRLPPGITFTRSSNDTSESIRERWEKDKASLTQEWKKAWREARGSRKGRVGHETEINGGY